ncbi:MAG: hypothetical protein IPP73_10190, partial [Chitinophagaceae bacterium]|nr:hypothetical protein [Chitinophagaceae bacterium]
LKDFCAKNNISLIPQRDIHEKGKTKYYLLVGKFCSVGAKLGTDFFDELKSKFNYNEELEMKLILLHDCLHPESAATTDISWLKPEQKKLVAKLLVINDNLKLITSRH